MPHHVLEQRMAEIEAIANNAMKTGEYASALLEILKVIARGK